MCLAGPGLVLWKVSLGNPIPRASFHLPVPRQRGQGPCAISRLSPFPLLAPSAAPPRCQVSSLLPRTFTLQWHQTPGLRGDKTHHKPCNRVQQWGKNPRDHKAAGNATGWVMVAKPFLQRRAMQQGSLPQHPAEYAELIVNSSRD